MSNERSALEERWPYPNLYRYIDRIGEEIALLDEEEAVEDFRALKFVSREATIDIWPVDRGVPKGDMVSYDQIWQIFTPGSVVVCRDDLECLWVLMLAKAQFKRWHMSLYAWQMGWDNVHQTFKRQMLKFHISNFHERRKLTSLTVYPLETLLKQERDELLSELRERGRKWTQLVSGPSLCFFYSGLSRFTYIEDPLARMDEDDSFQVQETISPVSKQLICVENGKRYTLDSNANVS